MPKTKKRPEPPDVIAIANRLRAVALHLRMLTAGRPSVDAPLSEIERIVTEIDAWEEGSTT